MENINNQEMLEAMPAFTTQKRRSRSADSREADGRSVSERPPIVFSRISQFELGEAVDGDRGRYQFGWTRYIVANYEVQKDFYDSIRAGWEPLSASEYPQLIRTYKDPFKKRGEEDEFIRVGGQIAMRRDLDIKESEDRYYDEENYHKGKLVEDHISSGTKILKQSRTRSLLPRGISFDDRP